MNKASGWQGDRYILKQDIKQITKEVSNLKTSIWNLEIYSWMKFQGLVDLIQETVIPVKNRVHL